MPEQNMWKVICITFMIVTIQKSLKNSS